MRTDAHTADSGTLKALQTAKASTRFEDKVKIAARQPCRSTSDLVASIHSVTYINC
jgi:hypothetical protein